MAIIGVTGEPQSKIESFAQAKNMKYVLGTGASYTTYRARSIPHAWLIGPRGTVVWKGHPSSLQEATIEKALEGVVLPPKPELPRSMKKVSALLAKASVDKAIKSLETHVKRPKNEGEDQTAKDAIASLEAYGNTLLTKAETAIENGNFHIALELLGKVEKQYKSHALGKKAKARKAELKKDKTTRVECDAAKYVLIAETYARQGKFPTALAAVGKVTKSKKYAEAKMLSVAKKLQQTLTAQSASGGAKKR